MRKCLLACLASLILVGNVNAQQHSHRIYSPYFNGYGYRPGYTVYSDGSYSIDGFSGHHWYKPGYVPARHSRNYNYQPYYVPGYYPWWSDYDSRLSPYHISNW